VRTRGAGDRVARRRLLHGERPRLRVQLRRHPGQGAALSRGRLASVALVAPDLGSHRRAARRHGLDARDRRVAHRRRPLRRAPRGAARAGT